METPEPPRAPARAVEPAFAMSVDVEDYFQVQAFAAVAPRDTWHRYPSRVVANTRRLLDLFDASETKATFFTLGCVAREHPQLVREIAARGHEVASHGVDHRMITELAPEEFRRQAVDSKSILEDLAGAPVLGYRAPSYSVGERTLWALEILRETGYLYDSSIYPIRGRRYGHAAGPTRPARIKAGEGTLAEFPLPTLSVAGLRVPVLAGAYLRLLPGWISGAAVSYFAARRIPLVVNVHPWELDPEQPNVDPAGRRPWTHYARLHRTEGILRGVVTRGAFRAVATRLRELGLIPSDPTASSTPPPGALR
jgi:polysaccharide deacetylase family protein (PEP-CTERM system associated)